MTSGCIAGKRMACFQSQGLQLLSWRWEGHTNTIVEEHWLILVTYGIRHDRAVPVAIHMSVQALLVPTPTHATLLPTRNCPLRVSIESPPETHGSCRAHQVDECIPKACLCLEVNGQVQKVILPREPLGVQKLEQHVPRVIVGHVSKHDSRAGLSSQLWQRLDWGWQNRFVPPRTFVSIIMHGLSWPDVVVWSLWNTHRANIGSSEVSHCRHPHIPLVR